MDLANLKAKPPDRAAAYELFKELEFSALTREFADAATVSVATDNQLNYRIVDSSAALESLVKSLWDAESVAIAIADPAKPEETKEASDPGDQQCVIDYEVAEGIAFLRQKVSRLLLTSIV